MTVDILEYKRLLALSEEQVKVLKEAMRDLQAALDREREFNASDRRINAEYLVNILRKFLMSTDVSERAKLVMVLCNILHLNAEETGLINEKWAVRRGLAGWLGQGMKTPAKAFDNQGLGDRF
jgi:GRIP domain